jgi:glycosyltransferase involved in cell wall biosynthesis
MKQKKICLISGGHLSSNPRLIKEADTLHTLGNDVHVLTAQSVPLVVGFDEVFQRQKPWAVRHVQVYRWSWLKRFQRKKRKARGGEAILKGDDSLGAFQDYISPWSDLHLKEIEFYRPDFIIAHTLPSLVTAAIAKEKWGIPFGFDLEDYHPGEREGGFNEPDNQRARVILRSLLPKASYVSAASPQISAETEREFGQKEISVILNCFPLDRQKEKAIGDRKGDGVSLYWFSQVLGLDRGLQEVIEACSKLKGKFSLHMRGYLDVQVEREIKSLALRLRISDRCHFLPWCSPLELMSRTRDHDIGLAVERQQPLNRNLCITNKILSYPVAGLAVAASKTDGQDWVIQQAPGMGFLYRPGNVDELSSGIQKWIDHPELLHAAKRAAWEAAQEKFCWEKEKDQLISVINRVL